MTMNEYALLIDGEFVETRHFDERPPHIPHKQIEWYPVVREYGEPGSSLENDTWFIRTVDPSTLPPPVPQTISDRQFFQQLAISQIITEAEALAAVKTGDLPASLQALVDAMPEQARFNAEMLLSGATTFSRNHPLTTALGQAMGYTSDQIDDLFRAAGAL